MTLVTLITVGEAPSGLLSDMIALMPGAQLTAVAAPADGVAAAAKAALEKGAAVVFAPAATLPEGVVDARKVLQTAVRTLTSGERVGVVTIAKSAIDTYTAWASAGVRDVITDAISCACSYDALRAAALQLKSRGAEVIVLDDPAFTATEASILAYDTGLEVVSVRSAVAEHLMKEVVKLPWQLPAADAEPWCLAG